MKANETKSVQVTFTLKKNTCTPVQLNKKRMTQTDEAKYLGIHLDRKLTWRKHIRTCKEKTTRSETTQTILGRWPEIAAFTGQQITSI